MITRKQRLLCRDHNKNKVVIMRKQEGKKNAWPLRTSVVTVSASPASRSFTVCTPIEAHKQTNSANLHVFTYLPPLSYSYLIEHLPQDLSVCLHSKWCTWQNRKCCYTPTLPALDKTSLYTNDRHSCHRTCHS